MEVIELNQSLKMLLVVQCGQINKKNGWEVTSEYDYKYEATQGTFNPVSFSLFVYINNGKVYLTWDDIYYKVKTKLMVKDKKLSNEILELFNKLN